MALLSQALKEKNVDVRMVARGQSRTDKSTITNEEYQKYLKSLPDDADNADAINLDQLTDQLEASGLR